MQGSMQGNLQGNLSTHFQAHFSQAESRVEVPETLLHQVVGGRYRVLDILGLGGFGKTYVSADLQRPGEPKCVLKHLHFSSQDEEMLKQARRMFAQEAATLERLGKHEQIPQLLAYFEEAGEFYLVQELVTGHPLSREIPEGTALSEAQTLELLIDVLQILDFVHEEGVIHRDLKPENLIRRQRDRRFVMIDFGAVKTIGAHMQVVDNSRSIPVYTTGYAASEQCLGKPQFNSDLYSLGMIAIQCLTGSHPTFIDYDVKTGEALWQGTVNAHPKLIQILENMTAYRSSDRYGSAQEVLEDLDELCQFYVGSEGIQSDIQADTQSFPLLPQMTTPLTDRPEVIDRLSGSKPGSKPSSKPSSRSGSKSLGDRREMESKTTPHVAAETVSDSDLEGTGTDQLLKDRILKDRILQDRSKSRPNNRPKNRSWQLPTSIASIMAAGSFGMLVLHPESPLRKQMVSGTGFDQSVLSLSSNASNNASSPATPNPGTVSAGQTSAGQTAMEDLPISQGDRSLLSGGPEKQAFMEAIATAKTQTKPASLAAVKTARDRIPTDPEALIYLNNLQVAAESTHTIAAVLPFSQFPETSAEVLRGIAQAQQQLNRQGGIGGKRITLVLADDRNQPDFARKIAKRLSEMPHLLGVIGHGGSDTTLAAADIYKQNQLVTIAPLSSATQLSSYSPYLFRTMPSDRLPAKALGQYMSDRLKKSRAIVFFNSTSTYSQSLKSEFKNALFYNQSDSPHPTQKTAEIIGEVDLSKPDFNPAAALKDAIAKKAEVIVLANGLGDADRALLIMQLNQNRLPILAGDALYSDTVRQVGSASGPGLTLAIPAQQLGLTQSIFHRQAQQIWQQGVTWRTALAYDATLALTQAIQQAAPNRNVQVQREQVREAIARSDFQVMGSVRPIRFTESGDPREAIQLVTLRKNPQSGQPEFMPLNPNSSANSKLK
jgi:ABC-type branched-subunit amino acid transport system substrate-binding protein/serine/threonine protein kinase